MTKLRRLDPQPADLTTYKGPFVNRRGHSARLICADCLASDNRRLVWLYTMNGEEYVTVTNESGVSSVREKDIFAAEEIPEPIVEFRVYDDAGIFGVYTHQKEAEYISRHIGGTIKKFVQDTSYGGGV